MGRSISQGSQGPANQLPDKLRCPKCGAVGFRQSGENLSCSSCGVQVPMRGKRFPDFLTPELESEKLKAELEFWNTLTGGEIYEDESEESYRQWADWMRVRANDEVLEIGCGSGALLRRLDCARYGLEPAGALLLPTQGFEAVIGTAESLPFGDDSFDLVYFKHSLHHVLDKREGLKQAARVTRPGGRVVVIEPNASHPQRRLISNPQGWLRRSLLFSRMADPVETFQTTEEVIADARRCGLKPERVIFTESLYKKLSPRQRLQKIYSRLLGPFLPAKWIMPNYFIEFSKVAKN